MEIIPEVMILPWVMKCITFLIIPQVKLAFAAKSLKFDILLDFLGLGGELPVLLVW